jgi:hypothetical protein
LAPSHPRVEEAKKRLCFLGGIEVKVDHGVPRIIDRTMNSLRPYAGPAAGVCERVERGEPRVEVGDPVLNAQSRQESPPLLEQFVV